MKGKHTQKRNNKKILIISIIMVFIIILCSMAMLYTKIMNKDEDSIKKTINKAFNSLKTANIEEVDKYIDYKQLICSLDEMIIEENEDEVSQLEKQLFNSIEWEIQDVIKEGNVFKVIVEMKNKNFKDILTKWMKEIVEKKEEKEVITNEYSLKTLEDIIEKNNTTKTITKEILVKKQKDEWQIIVNDDLRNLVYTGIESVATVINGEK